MRIRQPAPAGCFFSALLFGIPAGVFAVLFHFAGPALRAAGVGWWAVFHWILVAPLLGMLAAAGVGALLENGTIASRVLRDRFRLQNPGLAGWLWAAALAGFMLGGDWADAIAATAAVGALVAEKRVKATALVITATAILAKRLAPLAAGILEHIRFFTPSPFYTEFFGHFGPHDFMGTPLPGAWWVAGYYVVFLLVANVAGEELWWRGYVLPRQELAFGRFAWLVHGVLWSLFHLFIQPTLADTLRMTITGVALAYVAQRTHNTWPGIVGHVFGNLPLLLVLVQGAAAG